MVLVLPVMAVTVSASFAKAVGEELAAVIPAARPLAQVATQGGATEPIGLSRRISDPSLRKHCDAFRDMLH